ncbi:hypothetical protein [Methylobacterium sp. NEAU K]|uniref:hypothetical protein n=1 Tax=Methylobacterium sp. NEAU K TaxID=3064946 RepID=UPI002736D44A|nr:hypothetical protein [Methylobacterium sp. NEAU K]MDP4006437.1 hypothetical protein [Methylobacterium sp. NEAU K]
MEHYKSTLATTAFAVFGLVVAAHSLHPGNYETQQRPARTGAPASAAAPAGPMAWVDPPGRVAAPETVGAPSPDPRLTDSASATPSGLLAPRMTAVLPPGAVTAPALPREMTTPAEKSRTVIAAHRTKSTERGIRRVARLRHATLARTAEVDQAAAPSVPAPQQATKAIDPIGDLIRGLGLGRDG